MIPSRRLLVLLLAWLFLASASLFFPAMEKIWQWAGTVIFVLTMIDLFASRYMQAIIGERKMLPALALGNWSRVHVRLHNPSPLNRRIMVYDLHQSEAEVRGLPQKVFIQSKGWAELTYELRPLKRGKFTLRGTQLRVASFMGLWDVNQVLGLYTEVHVYPNFTNVMKYSLLATDQRLGQMGIRRKRRRGEGLEFHQLREYRDGDSLRQIDWKATSRMQKLISRDYQEERDQRVVFLIDCGRRMRAEDGNLSHFDHTLNAVLLLSHVALRQGDAVGLMTFGGEDRWLSPKKSVASINRVLNTLYDLEPSLQAPDYSNAAVRLLARQSRRSLVVLVTNVRDEDTDDLLPALTLLRRHHLVMLASMKEEALEEVLAENVDSFEDALEHAATHSYLAYRREAHERLTSKGVYTMDVKPSELPTRMVNRYLEIKSSGLL